MDQKHFTKGMTSNCLKGSHFVLGSACFYQSVQHEASACKTCPLQCLAFELWLFGKHAAKYQWGSAEYCGKWMQYEVGNQKCVFFIMYLYMPLYIMQCTYSFSHLFATSAVLQHWVLPSLLWPLHLADWNWWGNRDAFGGAKQTKHWHFWPPYCPTKIAKCSGNICFYQSYNLQVQNIKTTLSNLKQQKLQDVPSKTLSTPGLQLLVHLHLGDKSRCYLGHDVDYLNHESDKNILLSVYIYNYITI